MNFIYADAGNEAKRIIEEITMFVVLLSAKMVLLSHAPSNPSHLLPAKDAAGPTTELLPSQPAEEPIGKQGVGRMRMDFFGQICVAKSGATRWNASDIITEDKTFFRVLLAGIGIVMFSVCIRKAHSPRAGKLTFC